MSFFTGNLGSSAVRTNRSTILVAIMLMAIVFLVFPFIKPVYSLDDQSAVSEITLAVRPLVTMNYSSVPGENLHLNVTAYNVTSLHGFNMTLGYDATLVQCTEVVEGDLLSSTGNTTTMAYSINNAAGNVYASVNLTSPAAAIDGNGTLLRLTFHVIGVGETKFRFIDVSLYDTNDLLLVYTSYDGYFNNKVNFDLAMPLLLFSVTVASVFLNGKVEGRLKTVMEEREFRVRDAVLLVGMMAIMISLIVVVRQLSLVLMILFLFSYSMLLFIFGYVLSGNRWYVGAVAPAVFVLLYAFFRDSSIWFYYLGNIAGVIFAILITLYLASLFTWRTTAVFGVLITAMDIVLVLITGTMVEAANAARSLSLPVLVSAPLLPVIITGNGLLMMSLGLGDFFFAGLLTIQSYKKYGRTFALFSILAMTVSFFIFEAFILTSSVRAFPGTLMIICGWIPLILWKQLRNRKNKQQQKNT